MTRREWLSALGSTAFAATPAIDGEVYFASIRQLNGMLRERKLSSVELTKAFCDRLERLGPKYNALALMLRKPALETAKDADGDMKRERFRGPLQGIPYAAKDLLALAGSVTTWGAKPYADQKFDYTATVLERLSKKQSPLAAKLAMVELAGGPSYSGAGASLTGPCLNPWNIDRWAGGSSSGSGAAVAAGLTPFAIGTETSGSIVTPAAYCGITGLRPTFGLVSRHGAMSLSSSLDKIGPMCRTAEDCGIVLEAIAGGDSRDPYSSGKSFYFAPQFVRPLKDIRVAYAPVDFEGWAEPETRAAFRQALDAVRSMGVQLVEKALPQVQASLFTILSAEASHEFRALIESNRVDELADKQQIDGLRNGLKVTAVDYLKAKEAARELRDKFAEFFFEVDAVLAPSRTGVALKAGVPFSQQTPKRENPKDRGNQGIIPQSNIAGVPAISLPCGFVDAEGGALPVGIQFVARHWNENLLIKLGMEFQQRTDWHKRRPPGVA